MTMPRIGHALNLTTGVLGSVYGATHHSTIGLPWSIPIAWACGACAGYAAFSLVDLAHKAKILRIMEAREKAHGVTR